MARIRLVSSLLLLTMTFEVTGDDADAIRQRYERGYVTHAVITDDGTHIVTAAYRPAQDRGGFRWGAWVGVYDVSNGVQEFILDGMGPISMSPDQLKVAIPRYVRMRSSNRPDCVGLIVLDLDRAERRPLELQTMPDHSERRTRSILGQCWNASSDQVFALDGMGDVVTWILADTQRPAEVVDNLMIENSIGWGWRGTYPGVDLHCDGDDVLRLTVRSAGNRGGNTSIMTMTWQRDRKTGSWNHTSHTVEETEVQPAFSDEMRELPVEFSSPNGRFRLRDELTELMLTDSETNESTSLRFLPAPPSLRRD